MSGKSIQPDWSRPAFENFCPSLTDWARMAAYIDGEGSILMNTQKPRRNPDGLPRFYLRLMVANTDIRLMDWLKRTFGGNYVNANTLSYYPGKNVKMCWHWGCSSARAAWILHNCSQFFVIKGDQAEIGMSLQRSLDQFKRGENTRHLPLEVVNERRELKRRLLVMKARGARLEPDQARRIAEVS